MDMEGNGESAPTRRRSDCGRKRLGIWKSSKLNRTTNVLCWDEIEELRTTMEKNLEAQDERSKAAELERKSLPPNVVEGAPPAVLKELNRIRIQLAETERQERQLHRSVEDLQRRNKALIQEREEFRSSSRRLVHVQQQLEELIASTKLSRPITWLGPRFRIP
jgi:chromosome segregation ATPase